MKAKLAMKASAGSGKTFNLAVRFAALVVGGVDGKSPTDISKILALTFTNAATKEMKERILKILLTPHECEGEFKALCEVLGLTQEEVLTRLESRREEFLNASFRVMTFDAFFTQILRKFSMHKGLSPTLALGSEIGVKTKEMFLKKLRQKGELREFARFVKEFDNDADDIFKNLIKIASLNEPKINYPPLATKAMPTLKRAVEVKNQLAQIKFDFKLLRENIYHKKFNNDDLNSLIKLLDLENLTKTYFNQNEPPQEWWRLLGELKEELVSYLLVLESYKINGLKRLVTTYKEARLEAISALGKIGFKDVENFAYEITQENDLKELIYFRLDARIEHILIDEFQDANLEQYEIVKPLIDEALSGVGQSKNLGSFFYVGDTKQSIYRFRGSQSEIFDKVGAIHEVEQVSLKENFRSARKIVEFVNELFGAKYENYEAQKAVKEAEGFVEVRRIAKDEKLAEAALSQIRIWLENGVKPEQIAVLCWKNKVIKSVCEQLETAGVKAFGEGEGLLFEEKSVFLLIGLLRWWFLRDLKAAQRVMEFLEARRLQECRDEVFGEGWQELALWEKMRRFELFDKPREAEAADALGCVTAACKKLGLEVGEPKILQFCAIASAQKDIFATLFECAVPSQEYFLPTKEGAGCVKVMTIHKSKGLQYDYVIVLDNDRKDSGDKQFLHELNAQWRIDLRLNNKELKLVPQWREIKNLKERRDAQEKLNVAYVAFTRAKIGLCVIEKEGGASRFKDLGLQPQERGEVLRQKEAREEQSSQPQTPSIAGGYSPSVAEGFVLTGRQKFLSLNEEANGGFGAKQGAVEVRVLDLSSEENLAHSLTEANQLGDALHYFLQMCGDFSDTTLAKEAVFTAFGAKLFEDELEAVCKRAEALVQTPQFQQFLRGAVRVLSEFSCVFEGELLRFDAVVEKADEVLVLDYKSGAKHKDHSKQVLRYAQVLTQFFPDKRISPWLIYL